MERNPLLSKFFEFFVDPVNRHDEEKPRIPQDQFFYYALIPVAFAVVLLAFLQRRRWKRLDLLDGRPGVPWPINFLEERDNRLLYVAAFGLISWTAWDALTGDIPFWSKDDDDAQGQHGNHNLHKNLFFKNFARLSACLMSALICYPIFGSIASGHIIGCAFGSLYIWAYAVVYLVSNYPSDRDSVVFTIDLFQLVPAFVCMVYLCVQLPWICWKRGLKHWRLTAKHHSEHTMWIEDVKSASSYQYVQRLLAANRLEGIAARKRTLVLAASRIYRNIRGFRYSLSILVGVLVSVQFVYVGTLDMAKAYKSLITGLRYPLDQDINSSQWEKPRLAAQLLGYETAIKEDLIRFRRECKVWLDAFETSCYVSVALAFISTAAAILLTLRNYRRHLLLLYRGQRLPIVPSAERDVKPTNIVTNGAKYVGFQFGYAIWGFVYQAALLLLLCFSLSALYLFSFRYHKLRAVLTWIRDFLGLRRMLWSCPEKDGSLTFLLLQLWRPAPITTYVLGLLIVQRVLVHFFFLQRDDRRRLVLAFDNRRLLWNFQYFMVFANSTIGLVSCLIRIIKAVFFGAWTLPRLDVSMLNRHFERFDNGYAAYAGLLAIESCHTNPVLVTFTKLLWLSQAARHFQTSEEHLSESSQTGRPKRSNSTRSKTVRNRWHLYVTLHHNPGLRLLRKEAIRIDRLMHAEEVILDDALIEAPRLRLLLRRISERKDLI